MATISSF